MISLYTFHNVSPCRGGREGCGPRWKAMGSVIAISVIIAITPINDRADYRHHRGDGPSPMVTIFDGDHRHHPDNPDDRHHRHHRGPPEHRRG